MATLFPSCAETARRLSEAQDQTLPVPVRIGVTIHLAICRFCRVYRRQLRFLRHAFRSYDDALDVGEASRLPESARERIREALERRAD